MPDRIVYDATSLTGGGVDALDGFDGAALNDQDLGIVMTGPGAGNIVYFYMFDDDDGGSEDGPFKIQPDTNPGNGMWILQLTIPTLLSDLDFAGFYSIRQQNIPDLAAKGPAYRFDEVDDKITIADDANLDFGLGDFSFVLDINFNGSQTHIFSQYGSGTDYLNLYVSNGGSQLRLAFKEANVFRFAYAPFSSAANTALVSIAGVMDRDGGGSNYGEFTPYLNGQAGTPTEFSADTSAHNLTFGVGTTLYEFNTNYSGGSISRLLGFNLILSVTEVKALSSGAPVPYKYIGASQTNLITEGTFPNDPGVWTLEAGWTIPGGNVAHYDDSATKHISQDFTLIKGKKYRVSFTVGDAVGGGDAHIFFSKMPASHVPLFVGFEGVGEYSDGDHSFEAIAAISVSGIAIFSYEAGVAYDLSKLSIIQIGAVLQLEQPGIGEDHWIDTSGNALNGTVSGAEAINLPTGQVMLKTDGGDPARTQEGIFVDNTSDNTFKVYADGAWRTLGSW